MIGIKPLAYSSFGAIVLLTGAVILQNHRFKASLSQLPVQEMSESSVLQVKRLSRRQLFISKLAYLTSLKPKPDYLLIANHQLQYVGDGPYFKNNNPSFFNLWYGNISLSESLDVFRYLVSIKELPRKGVIFMITTPNNDNGNYILGYNNEVPLFVDTDIHKPRFTVPWIKRLLQIVHSQTAYTIDYKTVYGSIFGPAISVFDVKELFAEAPTESSSPDFFINKFGATFTSEDFSPLLIQNNYEQLYASKEYIGLSDADNIVSTVMKANQLADSVDLDAYFVIPPIFEYPIRDSAANRAVSLAVQGLRMSGVQILDGRNEVLQTNPDMFHTFDHPSSSYGDFLYNEVLKLSENPFRENPNHHTLSN